MSLKANPSLAGSLFAFFAFTHALSILVFGRLDTKETRLFKIGLGYLIQGFCGILFMSITNPFFLFLPLFLSATAGGMIAPAWKALYTKALTTDREGREWSFFDSGVYFSTSLGTLLGGIIANNFGYHAIFVPLVIINILSASILFSNKHILKQ